nr:MAG TPA: hypothetical protein [Caudoviricetes sp.]
MVVSLAQQKFHKLLIIFIIIAFIAQGVFLLLF